jgi:hypothetical protein
MANSVTLYGSIPANTHLDAGAHAGVFDGSSILPTSFVINSASFSFSFQDDADNQTITPTQFLGASSTPYSLSSASAAGYMGRDTYYIYTRNSIASYQYQRLGESEGVEVSLGGLGVGSGSTALSTASSTSSYFAGQSYDYRLGSPGYWVSYRCGLYGSSTCYTYVSSGYADYYTNNIAQTTVTTQDWTGGIEIAGGVSDLSSLNQLYLAGQLSFDMSVFGDLNLVGATLTLDITDTSINQGGNVPEPGTLALMGIALFCAAAKGQGRGLVLPSRVA